MRNCSFCRFPGHDIRYCLDIRIQENIAIIENDISRLNGEAEIEQYLQRVSLVMLRAHCIRFGLKMTLNKSYYVNFLKNYYSRHTRSELGIAITRDSSETEIKDYFCNYIKHYLTVIVAQELGPNVIIRFIRDVNHDISMYYRIDFTQRILVFIGSIWMKSVFNMMEPVIAVSLTNDPHVFSLLNSMVIPYWEHIDNEYAAEPILPEWKMDIQPMMICSETYDELQKNEECPICLTDQRKFDIVTTNCKHSFCKDCINKSLTIAKNARKQLSCALCRGQVACLEIKDVEEYNKMKESYCL
jgi:hypothetical protein